MLRLRVESRDAAAAHVKWRLLPWRRPPLLPLHQHPTDQTRRPVLVVFFVIGPSLANF